MEKMQRVGELACVSPTGKPSLLTIPAHGRCPLPGPTLFCVQVKPKEGFLQVQLLLCILQDILSLLADSLQILACLADQRQEGEPRGMGSAVASVLEGPAEATSLLRTLVPSAVKRGDVDTKVWHCWVPFSPSLRLAVWLLCLMCAWPL